MSGAIPPLPYTSSGKTLPLPWEGIDVFEHSFPFTVYTHSIMFSAVKETSLNSLRISNERLKYYSSVIQSFLFLNCREYRQITHLNNKYYGTVFPFKG